MERENDLKEQLERSEEESKEHRLKLSRLEDENESLVQQLLFSPAILHTKYILVII